MNLDRYFASWFKRCAHSFSGAIASGTSEIQRNTIATQVLGLPRGPVISAWSVALNGLLRFGLVG